MLAIKIILILTAVITGIAGYKRIESIDLILFKLTFSTKQIIRLMLISGLLAILLEVVQYIASKNNENTKLKMLDRNIQLSDSINNDLFALKEFQERTFYSFKNLGYQYEIECHLTDYAQQKLGKIVEDYNIIYSTDDIDALFIDTFGEPLNQYKSGDDYMTIEFKKTTDSLHNDEHLRIFPNNSIDRKFYTFVNGSLICHYFVLNRSLFPSRPLSIETLFDIDNTTMSLGIGYDIFNTSIFKNVRLNDELGLFFNEQKLPSYVIHRMYLTEYEDTTGDTIWTLGDRNKQHLSYKIHFSDSMKQQVDENQIYFQQYSNFYLYWDKLQSESE